MISNGHGIVDVRNEIACGEDAHGEVARYLTNAAVARSIAQRLQVLRRIANVVERRCLALLVRVRLQREQDVGRAYDDACARRTQQHVGSEVSITHFVDF